ncbi:MAG: radical SAM protein, partial [Actinomycetota bacterium]
MTPLPPGPTPQASPLGGRALSAELRTFRSPGGSHLFVVDGSRIYDVSEELAARIESWTASEDAAAPGAEVVWRALGLAGDSPRYVDASPLAPPPLASLSLTVMQACNMSCGYCYADEGRFGGSARAMSLEVARAGVDRLITESEPGVDLVLGYMGGEPLLNRRIVHEITRYAAGAAEEAGHRIRFSLTTNLTTLQPDDARLFAEFPFTVTVSVDGARRENDALRRMKDGSGAYDRVLGGLEVLQRHGRPRHLGARVTVTPRSGDLLPVLDHLIGLGFDEVGFAAVLVSPDPTLAFSSADFPPFLDRMIACGEKALGEIRAGRTYPFGNLETALHQIYLGTHRPYPCGAG